MAAIVEEFKLPNKDTFYIKVGKHFRLYQATFTHYENNLKPSRFQVITSFIGVKKAFKTRYTIRANSVILLSEQIDKLKNSLIERYPATG